ncbi:hypothetical protein SEVIR_8G040932v4 [Setaria viridis]
MIRSKLHDRLTNVVVEVVEKGYQQEEQAWETRGGSMASFGITSQAQPVPTFAEGLGETFSSNAGADQTVQEDLVPEPDQDGEAIVLANEDRMFKAMGFKDADERAEQAARTKYPIPVIQEQNKQQEQNIPFQSFKKKCNRT